MHQWCAPWAVVAWLWLPAMAFAGCFPVAQSDPRVHLAAYGLAASLDATARLTFLGHASFLIESRGGITAVTDYNGYHRASEPPRLVTMNNAHSTHFTTNVEPGVEHVLRGWSPDGGLAVHDVTVGDVRVRNVPTSVRGRAGAETNSNSIFVFEIEDLCIAHLGHLHHRLEDYHLAELGVIDVLLVPADGTWTLPHAAAAAVVEQIGPSVVVPMHYFSRAVLDGFIKALTGDWQVVERAEPSLTLSRQTLPYRHVIVLPSA